MSIRLKIVSAKLLGAVYEVDGGSISIGRDKTNSIVLNDASVSRRHCVIEKNGQDFFISDADSLNGTLVNGLPAAGTKLADGDQIETGDFTFRFTTGDESESSSGVLIEKATLTLPPNSVRLRIEEVFGEMARDLTAILKLTARVNTLRDPQTLQHEILRQIFEVIPADEGAILLVDSENEFVEIMGFTRSGESAPVSVSQTVISEVVETGSIIFIKDFADETRLQDATSLLVRKTASLLCAPIALFERTLGVIYLASNKSRFDESHLRFLTAVAGIAAAAIANARNLAFLEGENARLRSAAFERNMIGESVAMKKVFDIIGKAAPTGSTVLIGGESGTGKELAAQSIHLNSQRSERPFVAINCAALTETLLESELFGHEKGAFTGANVLKKGKIEIADGGTLFLDEIGEMNINLQAKILRVLQEKEFERVGGTRPIKADVRLVAASNRDLQAEVRNGTFRQDLFYRLNVVGIKMPALRDRREDILRLADEFAQKFGQITNRRIRGISAKAQKLLLKYDFPGNVRELQNAIERAVVLGSGEWILPEDLPEDFLELRVNAENSSKFHEALRERKKELILDAFRQARGSYVETARILDVHPNYLHRLIRNLAIKAEIEESL